MPRRRRWRFHPARQRHSEASCECQSVLVQTAVRAAGLTDAADGAGRSFTTANISTPAALAIGWFVQTMPLDAWAGVLKSGASASGWVDKRRASVGERRGMRSMRSSRHMGRRLRADVQRAAGLQRRCPTAFCALNRSGRWARGLFATTGNTRKAPVETAWTELTAAAAGAARRGAACSTWSLGVESFAPHRYRSWPTITRTTTHSAGTYVGWRGGGWPLPAAAPSSSRSGRPIAREGQQLQPVNGVAKRWAWRWH
jgi:hypothetical protein